jgi:hypothetical protein
MKVCSRCKNEKELNMFYKRKTSIDGLRSECKECLRIYCGKYKEGYKENNLKSVIVLSKKICSKCKIEKYSDEYHRKLNNKDGLSYNCKQCASLENKVYKEKNREVNNSNRKEYYQNNKEYFSKKSKEYYEFNKEKVIENNKEYYSNNKEYFSEKAKEYKINNKEKLKEYNKEYMKVYAEENKVKRSKYERNKKNIDPLYKLSTVVRNSIRYSIKVKNYYKKNKTDEILGCSYDEFRIYIESRFEDWMNWNNHGLYNGDINFGWDLDHIIPLSSARTEEEIILLNHYTNFQPLCSFVNRYIKRDRLDYIKIDTI